MSGHIIFLSCLLAICLPIICVQFPRFDLFKDLHAETEPETRSTLLRGRSLSPQEALRREPRCQPKADPNDTSAKSKQREGCPEEEHSSRATARRRHTGVPRPIFQGDASADHRASSQEEDKAKETRISRKPWDVPFRRQPAMVVPGRRSPVGRRDADTSSSPPCRTGGVATKLFSPDQVRRLDLMNSDEHQSMHSKAQGIALRDSGSVSLPSPFDGSPISSGCHTPQGQPKASSKRHSCCHHRHRKHVLSNASLQQTSDCPNAAAKGTPRAVASNVSKPTPNDIAEKVNEQAATETSKVVSIKRRSSLIPWKALLFGTGLMIFIFAFAILVAHCLAWFLVYKTEARLGEVRSGLLRGGEMKLCLCGKG